MARASQGDESLPRIADVLQDLRVHQVELEMQNEQLRQTQGALEAARDRYEELYDFAPVGYLTLTEKGLIRDANLTGASLLGLERGKLRGRQFAGFIEREDLPRWRELVKALLGREAERRDVDLRLDREGGPFHARLVCNLQAAGDGPPMLRIAFTDVSELRRSEEEIRQGVTQFQALLDAVPAAVFVTRDPLSRRMETNRFGSELIKVPLDANVSKSAGPEAAALDYKAMRNGREVAPGELPVQIAAAQGIEVRDYEFDLVSGGTTRHLLGNATPLLDESGRPAGAVGAFVDITARKQAEEEKEAAWTFARLTLDALHEEVCVLDDSGTILFTNAAWRAFAAANQGTPDHVLEGANYLAVCRAPGVEASDEEPLFSSRLRALLAGAIPAFSLEYDCHSPAGKRWFVVHATRFLEGDHPRVVVAHQEVTERRKAEEELREREAQLRAYFDSPAVGVAILTSDARFLEVNAHFCELLGYAQEEILGMSWPELTHPDDVERDIEDAGRLMRGEVAAFTKDKRYVRKDGTVVWAMVSVSSVRGDDGQLRHLTVIVKDIGKRKAAEEALHRSELLYRTVVRHFPRGIVGLFDGSLRMLLNDGTRSVVTDDPTSLVGKRPSEFAPTGEGAKLEALFRETLSGVQAHGETHHEGRIFEVNTYPVRDDEGKVILGMVMTEDTTDRRAMQDQLQVASRLAALGTLVAGVAHEINNPLAGTMAGQGMAIEEVRDLRGRALRREGIDPDSLMRELDQILEGLVDAQAGVQRIARIVKDLSTFGRPDPRKSRMRLVDVVEEAMRWLPGSVASTASIEVVNTEAPDVIASAGQLGQVIVNLVTNAAKSIPAGRRGLVTIRVGTGSPGMARVEVADNGAGIAPEVMQRIFDPFFTTREIGQGMGLGLPICHAIVTAHGGTITAMSTPGEGSTFRVELPAAES